MAEESLTPTTCMVVHERSPKQDLLYVSKSIRKALLYEPNEVVGRSIQDLVADAEESEPGQKSHCRAYAEDNATMKSLFVKRKDGKIVYLRSVIFACGGVNLGIATVYPHITPERVNNKFISVQKLKYILNDTDDDDDVAPPSSRMDNKSRDAIAKKLIRTINKTSQACIVLGDMCANKDSRNNWGPKVVFATDSISKILEVNPSDLKGRYFLSMVSIHDILKAAAFLENPMYTNTMAIARLRILSNPVKSNQLGNPKCVSVEFMAMGTDDGAVMLCQLDESDSSGDGDSAGYRSFEEIMYSDPLTTDFD
ncbi:hypothetical protein GGI12_002323 [Dipsacomyces acuminosporus]|nr:hypothetical protein GGI12_002323 [Dipsacomyces acuminosporus]